MRIKSCLTNSSDLWKTPKDLYNFYISNGFFDPCPSEPTFDGLNIHWKDYNFVNPPYSKIKLWVEKAIFESYRGCSTVFLLPSRTDTNWFKLLIEFGVYVTFLNGRLKFNDCSSSAPFPSMLVYLPSFKGFSKSYFTLLNKDDRWWEN